MYGQGLLHQIPTCIRFLHDGHQSLATSQLGSQVAQNKRPLCPKVAHNSLKVAPKAKDTGFPGSYLGISSALDVSCPCKMVLAVT